MYRKDVARVVNHNNNVGRLMEKYTKELKDEINNLDFTTEYEHELLNNLINKHLELIVNELFFGLSK